MNSFFLQKLNTINIKIGTKTPTILPNKSENWNDLFGINKCNDSRIIDIEIKYKIIFFKLLK